MTTSKYKPPVVDKNNPTCHHLTDLNVVGTSKIKLALERSPHNVEIHSMLLSALNASRGTDRERTVRACTFSSNAALTHTFVFEDTPSYGYDISKFTGELRAPYTRCVFVLPRFAGGCFVAQVTDMNSNGLLVTGAYRVRGDVDNWTFCKMSNRIHLQGGKIDVAKEVLHGCKLTHKERTMTSKNLDKATRAILAVIDRLDKKKRVTLRANENISTSNPHSVEFSFNTVRLNEVVITPNPPLGGTHASPREHTRRGHWRTYGDKKVWIDDMVVNKGKGGRVDKEYHI